MENILTAVAVIYGVSVLAIAAGGLAWTVSARFRESLIGDRSNP